MLWQIIFLNSKALNVGASLLKKDQKIVKNIYVLAEKNKCNIIIPIDCNTSSNLNGNPVYKSLKDIGSKDMILDIGKNTLDLINQIIDKSNTVFWNGPAGYYENKNFSTGSLSIAKKIAENTKSKSLISIVGGGDTVAAIKNTELEKGFYTFINSWWCISGIS